MIYLDNNASTALLPEVWAAMADGSGLYGNPSSVHGTGQQARRALEQARGEVACLLGAQPGEVFLTSGGTESNAMAIFGACAGGTGRIVVSGIEHPSVRECVARLESAGGFEVVAVAPDASGALDPERLLEAVVPGTVLTCVMAANNEYGGVLPVSSLAPEVRRRGSLFHTDAVQAAGRVPVDAVAWGVDLLSISAHKLHGPKGAGALYVRRGVSLSPYTPGGGQEKRLRGGTENTLAALGFAAAARAAVRDLAAIGPRMAQLRDRLEQGILERIERASVIGAGVARLPNTSAVQFAGAPGEALLIRLDLEDVAVSVGSACSSGSLAPSPALLALGLPELEARCVVRFSLSRLTTEEDIEGVLAVLPGIVSEVREASSSARCDEPALSGSAS